MDDVVVFSFETIEVQKQHDGFYIVDNGQEEGPFSLETALYYAIQDIFRDRDEIDHNAIVAEIKPQITALNFQYLLTDHVGCNV